MQSPKNRDKDSTYANTAGWEKRFNEKQRTILNGHKVKSHAFVFIGTTEDLIA